MARACPAARAPAGARVFSWPVSSRVVNFAVASPPPAFRALSAVAAGVFIAGAPEALEPAGHDLKQFLTDNAAAARRFTGTWTLVFFLILLVVSNISIAMSQIGLGVALAGLLAWWRLGGRPTRTGLEWPSLLLAGWALAVIPFSSDPAESVIFYRRFYLLTVIWIAASMIDTSRRRRWALVCLLLGAVGICLYGQIHTVLKTGGLFNERLGDMSNPMTSGALLMMVLLVAAGQILVRGQRWRVRLWVGLVAAPIFLGLVLTMTRSAWLGLVAGIAAVLILGRTGRGLLVTLTFVAALVFLPNLIEGIFPARLAARFQLSYFLSGRSTTERLEMWRGGLAMVRAHPVLGVGDCDLKDVAPAYYGDETTDYYGHLHSNPVMFAAIWGVPGFVLAWVFLLAQLRGLWRMWRRTRPTAGRDPPADPLQRGWILGAVGVWFGFFVAGLTEWYFGDAESMLLYLAIIGIALAPAAAGVRPRDAHRPGGDHV